MEVYDNVVKRFKFDLEMGRFKEYIDKCYVFKGDLYDLESFSNLLVSMGFHWYLKSEYRFNGHNTLAIDLTDNTILTCYEKTNPVNEIPDYIKEYFEHDIF